MYTRQVAKGFWVHVPGVSWNFLGNKTFPVIPCLSIIGWARLSWITPVVAKTSSIHLTRSEIIKSIGQLFETFDHRSPLVKSHDGNFYKGNFFQPSWLPSHHFWWMIVSGFRWIWVAFFLVDFSGCQWILILMDFLWILVHFTWAPPSEKKCLQLSLGAPYWATAAFTTRSSSRSSSERQLAMTTFLVALETVGFGVFLTNKRFWCNYSLFGCSIIFGFND